MEYTTAKEIHKAIKDNIATIQALFANAKKMQDSISGLQNESDKELMTQNFNSVVESINSLVKSTERLFDTLETLMDEQYE